MAMAVSSFLAVVIDKLIAGPLLEYARRQKVDLTLQEWRKKLLHIEAVMNDAEEKQIRERAVKVWLDDLKALAYDIEDVLDELVTKANRHSLTEGPQPSSSKVRKFIPTFHPSRSVFNGKISKKIKKITEDLDTIANRKFDLYLREGVGEFSFSAEERLTTSLVDEFGVYGRDADREKIMELLLSDEVSADQKVGVIPIVGMGGVGKTTLAQIIYNDKRVEDHFDTRTWVCVSDQFDLVEITKAILESVTKDSSHSRNLQFLQDGLKKELNGKRFLLVLDDIWNENPNNWSVLQAPFRVGAHGSFVMVTTRNENVASIMRTTASYHLNELSDKYCWSLFAHLAFENITSDALQSLELIDENAWKEMLNNKIWDLPADQSSILPALHLSYHYLPTKLKQCFAYCSIFPKGYEFEKKQLILLWMGEGLVDGSRRGETVEKEGKLKHLRYLDLSYTAIHKLPESIGMLFNLQTLMLSNCNFLSEVPSEIGKLINLRYFDISKTKLEGMPMGINRLKDLQVLTTFVVGWKHTAARIKDLRDLSQLGGTLSILNLQNVVYAADALEANLKDKGKLDHLVFGWDCNAVSGDFQNQTRVLENLQPHNKLKTLTIEYYYGTKFPNWLASVSQGPLYCENWSAEVEEWTCSQVEFPCLEELYVQKCPKLKGEIPKHLPLLTKLEITECGQLVDSLPMVPSLCELKLTECNDVVFRSAVDITSLTSLIVNDICKIPLELQHLHSLVRLTIDGCPELREVPPILHKLNSLKQLVIKGCSSLQSLLEMGLPPMLQKLDIEKCGILESLEDAVMQNNTCLQQLTIKDCGSLRFFRKLEFFYVSNCTNLESLSIPDGIHHVEFTSLNYMYINNCPNLVSFPQGGLSAPNLSVLILQQCKKLKSLPQGMHTLLTSLEILLMEHRMEWGLQRLPFLKIFYLRGCKEEISDPFPEMWLLPSTLTFLIIEDFPNLKSLAKEGFSISPLLKALHFQLLGESIQTDFLCSLVATNPCTWVVMAGKALFLVISYIWTEMADITADLAMLLPHVSSTSAAVSS
ncbi:Disease resistance protein RGA2 [Vitis vinifera]|uniref:Disease resistance protein RGA2 n=1 Tax=Vitis vinifera TaxID=29760 RepID=A0A438JWS6_VITVI|nr:Disease resistance protein RGA2 [Vitis vinifera]